MLFSGVRVPMMQLNFLLQRDDIIRDNRSGKYIIEPDLLFAAITELAHIILMIEIKGDYSEAEKFIEQYGVPESYLLEDLGQLEKIPYDLDLSFNLDM
jgi:hypothetical protein